MVAFMAHSVHLKSFVPSASDSARLLRGDDATCSVFSSAADSTKTETPTAPRPTRMELEAAPVSSRKFIFPAPPVLERIRFHYAASQRYNCSIVLL
ncbi:hypothetical protein Q1695_015794 [Nippostrongylus brasiliensis]|nr:hypothetical protein Q1695_015794 [Nippostrongylus brasiliensis]